MQNEELTVQTEVDRAKESVAECEEVTNETDAADATMADVQSTDAAFASTQDTSAGESEEERSGSCAECSEGEAEATPEPMDAPIFPLDEPEEVDYRKRAEEDMRDLVRLFPELSPDGESITLGELRNPTRFAELREAGLSVEEAFLASNYRMLAMRPTDISDNENAKAHLTPALPRSNGRVSSMPTSLLLRSRSLFEGLSDAELASLYRRVTH